RTWRATGTAPVAISRRAVGAATPSLVPHLELDPSVSFGLPARIPAVPGNERSPRGRAAARASPPPPTHPPRRRPPWPPPPTTPLPPAAPVPTLPPFAGPRPAVVEPIGRSEVVAFLADRRLGRSFPALGRRRAAELAAIVLATAFAAAFAAEAAALAAAAA